jgi:hypothetical protein
MNETSALPDGVNYLFQQQIDLVAREARTRKTRRMMAARGGLRRRSA